MKVPDCVCCNQPDDDTSSTLIGKIYAPNSINAYDIAVKNGFEGTEEEWLESLIGEDGESAYQIAVDNGFIGTEEEWLKSLVGKDGKDGKDGTLDHSVLINRDFEDSHPISAISDLEPELNDINLEVSKKQDTMIPMNAQDIIDICV